MKKINQYTLLIGMFSIFLLGSCASPGGSSRKKMPELTTSGSDFSTMHLFSSSPLYLDANDSRYGFSTGFTSVAFNGSAKECISVALPESLDQQAFSLIGLYKPFASTLIAQWARQQTNSLVLDFSDGKDQKRSDYLIQSKDNPDIAVVVLWNERSSKRVSAYLAQVNEVAGLSLKQLNR